MNDFETNYCKRVMQKIESTKVSAEFFNRIKSDAPNGSKNSDFSKIKEGLTNKLYTKQEWVKSMRGYFQNIMNSYREDSIIFLIASDLSKKFEKNAAFIPRNAQEEWLVKFGKAQKIAKLLSEKTPFK